MDKYFSCSRHVNASCCYCLLPQICVQGCHCGCDLCRATRLVLSCDVSCSSRFRSVILHAAEYLVLSNITDTRHRQEFNVQNKGTRERKVKLWSKCFCVLLLHHIQSHCFVTSANLLAFDLLLGSIYRHLSRPTLYICYLFVDLSVPIWAVIVVCRIMGKIVNVGAVLCTRTCTVIRWTITSELGCVGLSFVFVCVHDFFLTLGQFVLGLGFWHFWCIVFWVSAQNQLHS